MITVAAIDRGLDFEGMKEMEIGQIVDYCIQWNEVHDQGDGKKKQTKKRKANQGDWDSLLG